MTRSLLTSAYLPALLYETGLGAVTPVVALVAAGMGAGLDQAALVVALVGVGQILGDVPAGALAARVGDRRAMLVAALVACVALAVSALAPTLPVLAVGVLLTGAASAVFHLARQAYLTEVVPVVNRARALSTLGGVSRIGVFLGPFLGAAVLHVADLRAVFWLAVGTTVAAAAVVGFARDVDDRRPARDRPRVSTAGLVRRHRRLLATLGLAVVLVGAVRATRGVVLPLWSEHLGFAPATTSLVFGLSGAVDMLLFYPAGRVMDRRGRLWVAVPSMLVLGGAIAVLPLTSTLTGLSVVAMVMGLGNGIGSGILMTLGADVAPPDGRAQFLGVWRVFQDSGAAAGPLVVSAVAAAGSLAAGIVTMGAAGLLAAGALAAFVPRWSEHATAGTRARAAAAREVAARAAAGPGAP
ncbi:MFS transporter [Cellulomonas sp. ACRRI]|uniref:MFS transporter n=1 Tax=Cellulomonas sp. ACRRI TaxID=2918188 RepID=UPI001EF224C9|nr:MFS transporter [Cellulomonas sp. ACRRI]MCG7288265.1 MFS transporter [Cellulomonas sp. ACRRI]